MVNIDMIYQVRDLIHSFSTEKAWSRSEDHIQTYFTARLLEYLGWTSAHVTINEGQAVKTGKKPDILLHDSGSTLIVIESKDASKSNILDGHYQDQTFVEQLFGYCKGEGIVWGILTNFVEWRVYSVQQEMLYQNAKYAFHDLLWSDAIKKQYVDILSEQGLLFLEKLKYSSLLKEKGRWDDDPVYYPKQKEIKERFFRDLKKWRQYLRNSIVDKYNKKYNVELIEFVTQQILDRFIFIDYCSDTDIITQDRLNAILYSKGSLNQELSQIFSEMNKKFNSELFAQSVCDEIEFDDKTIRMIIEDISTIDFKTMSANVIGEVYESYLSELLKIGKAGIKLEEAKGLKKKKEQGIYYTPDYVVGYIVENTLGQILSDCKSIEEIDCIRVLDPACGSGSFLIRVFDEFLKHYRRLSNEPLLEFEARKRILQNNIFGVDYDERAVEIAKLNLLLKALEGGSHLSLAGQKILPNLKLNIRCGNSLLSGEVVEKREKNTLMDIDKPLNELCRFRRRYYDERGEQSQIECLERIRMLEDRLDSRFAAVLSGHMPTSLNLKPFNYAVAFPEAFSSGGFDCIVGNPPYIDSELMTKEQPETRKFISEIYGLTQGNWDIYIAFLERAFELTKPGGYWGFITPDKWLSKPFGEALRSELFQYMTDLVKVGRDVFTDANVDAIITVFKKKRSTKVSVFEFKKSGVVLRNKVTKTSVAPPFLLDTLFSAHLPLLQKIEAVAIDKRLSFECESACATSDAYDLKPFIKNHQSVKVDSEKYFKVTNTGTIAKFKQLWGRKEMTYLADKYIRPVVDRKRFIESFGDSYVARAKRPKLIIKGLTLLDACIDFKGDTIPGKSTLVILANDAEVLKFLAAIFNSQLAIFFISEKYPSSTYNQGITFTKEMIMSLPIPKASEIVLSHIIECVDSMIKLNAEVEMHSPLEKSHCSVLKEPAFR